MKKAILILAVICCTCLQSMAQPLMFAHPWQGKRVAYFGDSITDPNNNGSTKKYWHFLQEWLGITPYVYAISGRQWNDIPRQTDELQKQLGDSIDAILIFIGTNDYNDGVPIGQWYEDKDEMVMYGHHEMKKMTPRKRQYLCMDKNTYVGRINIALSKIKQTYPDKQVVLLTPIHRAQFHAHEKNWQCTEDYTNQIGLYLKEYVDAVKEAGNVWSVPVIDMNALCGLYPMIEEHGKYFHDAKTDRLHPNDLGHERMAKTLLYQLLTLPVY